MINASKFSRPIPWRFAALAMLLASAGVCAQLPMVISLIGDAEVPAVKTSAKDSG